MNQTERRLFLIKKLLSEQSRYHDMGIPKRNRNKRDCCVLS